MKIEEGGFEMVNYVLKHNDDIDFIETTINDYKTIYNELIAAASMGLYNDNVGILIASLYLRYHAYLNQYCEVKKTNLKQIIIDMKKASKIKDENEESSKRREKFFGSSLLFNNLDFGHDKEYTLKCIESDLTPYDIFVKCHLEEWIIIQKSKMGDLYKD